MILPLKKTRFAYIPNKPQAYCHKKYGMDSLKSALPHVFDHNAWKPTDFPKVRVPIDEINALFGYGQHPFL
jgi:hypothetical protein